MRNIFLWIAVIGLLVTSCAKFDAANSEFSKGLENKGLKELRLDLIQNLTDINANIELLKVCKKSNEIIIKQIENSLPYHDSLDYHFANVYPYLIFSPNETTFTYLKQKGMFLISNDSIREAVSDLYGVQYEVYSSFERIYFVEHYTNYIKPMFITEFETFKFYRSFKPRRYSEFIKNHEYKRIMRYTIDAVQSFIFMQSNLKKNIEKLIVDIDEEVN
ncbi:MAG: hypothetical protein JKZ00_00115 [Flavobacteriaceae bacterium]|nr:hypothetical protein [Flavobacteriaceae bacterium]